MRINDFKLECYFGKYEFAAPYLLTQSDCESMTAEQLLDMEPAQKRHISGSDSGMPRHGAIRSFGSLSPGCTAI